MKSKWTIEKTDQLKDIYLSTPMKQLMQIFHCSRSVIYYHATQLNVIKNFNYPRVHQYIQRICKNCGNSFVKRPSELTHNRGKFCRTGCGTAWRNKNVPMSEATKKKIGLQSRPRAIKINRERGLRQGPTSIELKVRQFLESIGIKFEEQKVIPEGRTVVDFYIPEQHLVLYADGLYWHSKPGCKEKDERQNMLLSTNGFNVLRLPEKNIKDNTFQELIQKELQ